jgi:hypothetical protein
LYLEYPYKHRKHSSSFKGLTSRGDIYAMTLPRISSEDLMARLDCEAVGELVDYNIQELQDKALEMRKRGGSGSAGTKVLGKRRRPRRKANNGSEFDEEEEDLEVESVDKEEVTEEEKTIEECQIEEFGGGEEKIEDKVKNLELRNKELEIENSTVKEKLKEVLERFEGERERTRKLQDELQRFAEEERMRREKERHREIFEERIRLQRIDEENHRLLIQASLLAPALQNQVAAAHPLLAAVHQAIQHQHHQHLLTQAAQHVAAGQPILMMDPRLRVAAAGVEGGEFFGLRKELVKVAMDLVELKREVQGLRKIED